MTYFSLILVQAWLLRGVTSCTNGYYFTSYGKSIRHVVGDHPWSAECTKRIHTYIINTDSPSWCLFYITKCTYFLFTRHVTVAACVWCILYAHETYFCRLRRAAPAAAIRIRKHVRGTREGIRYYVKHTDSAYAATAVDLRWLNVVVRDNTRNLL